MLKVKCITIHISFAKGHLIKKSSTDSSESQKHTFYNLYIFFFARLSSVRQKNLLRVHIKILIFNDTLIFHKCFSKNNVCPFKKSAYKDFTVNFSEAVKFQTNYIYVHCH
jgi:hypothetical protein